MRIRAALCLALLAAGVAEAAHFRKSLARKSGFASTGRSGPAPAGADFLKIMVASSSVGTVNDNLCSGFPAELTGGYYCLHGDGTATNQTLTAHGAAAPVSVAVCPNGTDCANVSALRVGMTAADYYTTANYIQSQSDWSQCILYRLPSADTGTIMHHAYKYWTTDSGGTVYPDAFKDGGGDLYANFAARSGYIHAWTFSCVTYDFVADGSSLYKVYSDAVLTTDITDATGPIGDGSNVPTFLGIRNNGTEPQNVDIREVFYTEKILSGATITAMNNAVRIKLKGDAAEAITFARNTVGSCTRTADGVLTPLAIGQACANSYGAQSWETRQNADIRSEEFGNAAWTCTDVTVTSNTHRSPSSSLTADTLESTVNGGFCESTASAMVGATGTTSIHARTASGTQTGHIVLRDTTAGATKCTGTISGTTAWLSGDTRANCSSAITSGNDHTTRIYPGGTGGTGTMVVWGDQREVGESMSPYVPTTTTAVTRDAEDVFITTAQITQTSGCWAATGTFTASTTVGAALLSHEIEGILAVAGSPPDSFAQSDLIGDHTVTTAAGTALAGTTVVVRGDWASAVSTPGVRVPVESEVAGTQRLSRAGAGTVSGTHNGDMSPNESLWLGSRTTEDKYLNGYIKDIKVNTNRNGCQP